MKGRELMANPKDFLDARPFRDYKRYHARNYRVAISEPMMIILAILTLMIFYLKNTIGK